MDLTSYFALYVGLVPDPSDPKWYGHVVPFTRDFDPLNNSLDSILVLEEYEKRHGTKLDLGPEWMKGICTLVIRERKVRLMATRDENIRLLRDSLDTMLEELASSMGTISYATIQQAQVSVEALGTMLGATPTLDSLMEQPPGRRFDTKHQSLPGPGPSDTESSESTSGGCDKSTEPDAQPPRGC